MTGAIHSLFDRAAGAFRDARTGGLARDLAFANIVCLGRHTIAGTITTCGRQDADWSSAYRLFEHERIDEQLLFQSIRQTLVGMLPAAAPITVAMDDTLLPKRGRRIANAAWHHDPQGPAFVHQIIWSQRVVQVCGLLAQGAAEPSSARAIPLGTVLVPQVNKPGKRASAEEMKEYRKEKARHTAPNIGAKAIGELRTRLDNEGRFARDLHVVVDGGYTNKSLLRMDLKRTVIIGRIRKDAKLRALPPAPRKDRPGRPRKYGGFIARPAELLADKSVGWQSVEVFAAGALRTFKIKTHEKCCWPSGSLNRPVRVIVIQPLEPSHDRVNKRRLFFAHPGYLICTDPGLDPATVVQAYVQRWEMEVGFREQKTTLGLGQAQTTTLAACRAIIGFQSYCYALLLLAAAATQITTPPLPKWQKPPSKTHRPTISQLIGTVRGELWGKGIGTGNFADFVANRRPQTKPPKIENALIPALLNAAR